MKGEYSRVYTRMFEYIYMTLFDPEKYLPMLSKLDCSRAEKIEVINILASFADAFIDIALGEDQYTVLREESKNISSPDLAERFRLETSHTKYTKH